MMTFRYVGPKPEISHHGVSFIKSKEDKYLFLPAALEVLKDLEDDFSVQPCHSHTYTRKQLDTEALTQLLSVYDKDFEVHLEKTLEQYRQKIADEKEVVRAMPQLSSVEKEAWLNNIDQMYDYRIQRMMNKVYYECAIEAMVEKIRAQKIQLLTVCPDKPFLHLLHSIKNRLALHKPPVDADIAEEVSSDGKITATLRIKIV